MFSFHRTVLIGLGQHLRFSLSAVVFTKNHYDSLGLTPKATQNDIKSAYYKMSMVYHPDKNKGSESALQKFRDITEAYEVLGNFRLRKLYDKGLLHTAGPQYAAQAHEVKEEDDDQTKFYKSRMNRSKAPPASGRTPIYDFDEWSQAHYGNTFRRRVDAKRRYESKLAREQQFVYDAQLERVLLGVGALLCAFVFASMIITENRDVNHLSKGKENNSKKNSKSSEN